MVSTKSKVKRKSFCQSCPRHCEYPRHCWPNAIEYLEDQKKLLKEIFSKKFAAIIEQLIDKTIEELKLYYAKSNDPSGYAVTKPQGGITMIDAQTHAKKKGTL